ncbi:hypothetical protein BDN72DRAFT_831541 [Pluteus cervinus]|uniref:Uncharacterized protein n=1 Tax=Pluteus cervinus TaxID=181527 RepID=A0ACD3BEL1_9AGAR|nr:hypothetical protein BDN72DRAFT_831541 [Pluteus cervinus]
MTTRSRHREDVDKAYELQSRAALIGAFRAAALGTGLTLIAHHSWPLFRRQTLAFKAFLISGFAMAGLTFGAENALLKYESERRREENLIRRQARIDLAKHGLIGTETEIAKWRAARESPPTE